MSNQFINFSHFSQYRVIEDKVNIYNDNKSSENCKITFIHIYSTVKVSYVFSLIPKYLMVEDTHFQLDQLAFDRITFG